MQKPLLFLATFLFPIFFTGIVQANQTVKVGGLTAYPQPVIGKNILLNPTFKNIDATTGAPADWRLSKAFSLVPLAANDSPILQMKDAPLFPYAESAIQEVFLTKGSYRFGGKVKTDLSDPTTKGVRFSIPGVGSTRLVGGTNNWQLLSTEQMYVPKDGKYIFKVESYSEPAGTAWFDGLYLERESQPLEVFLKYPNYRGILFDDQSQTVKLAVNVELPPDSDPSEYAVVFSIIDEADGAHIYTNTLKVQAAFTKDIDCSKLSLNKSYTVNATLIKPSTKQTVYEYPAYRIVKLPGKIREEMTVSFDENNRFLVKNKPTFWLGVYDSGMGYPSTESQWEKMLHENRRLFELPINLYLNYWYGQATLPAMRSLMNVLNRKNIYYLQTGNVCNTTYDPNYFAIDKDASYLKSLSAHSGLAGFYTVDEAVSSFAPIMFTQYVRLKEAKPDGITFAALLNPNGLRYWRDTVDVLSMDPYPLAGSEPVQGYNLSLVADWTRATREATMDSRPFMSVLQFFKQTSKGRFPTKDELRNMSFMAITEGANGLMYWSLGAKALAYVCKDWCAEREAYFEMLKTIMTEIKGLDSALTSIDRPELLAGNSNNQVIHTRVKFAGGKAYLFAYNYSNKMAATNFLWSANLSKVKVYNEGREIVPHENQFKDTFNSFGAHVYEITIDKNLVK